MRCGRGRALIGLLETVSFASKPEDMKVVGVDIRYPLKGLRVGPLSQALFLTFFYTKTCKRPIFTGLTTYKGSVRVALSMSMVAPLSLLARRISGTG